MSSSEVVKKVNPDFLEKETVLKGLVVSRGVGIGQTVGLYGRKRQFYFVKIAESKVENELNRFRSSLKLAKKQLKKIAGELTSNKENPQLNIFDAHLAFLEDSSLLEDIENIITKQRVNSEWAVKMVSDRLVGKYKEIEDEHLRERYIDLEDVTERILTALGGGNKSTITLQKNAILFAKEIKPSTIVELIENKPQAIITENGGWTSHTFILARELNIPAITGVKGLLRFVNEGQKIIVDGFNGEVILNPSVETSEKFADEINQTVSSKNTLPNLPKDELKTLDGHKITIRANVDLTNDYLKAKTFGAKGVGLYRSEFLFNQNKGYPTEREQIENYKKISEIVGEDGVKIRTFDLRADQITETFQEKERNPALGLRGIRLSLRNKKQFQRQIRSILIASYEKNIDILFPMISDVSEILAAKKIIEKEKRILKRKKCNYGNPKIGAMIETPSAILLAEEILAEVDFVNLGTNDLVQYMLAVDRDNESVADWFRTLHPAVLKAIKIVIRAGEKFNKPVILCGEMAGSPVYAAILIGLGAVELSMNLNSIKRIGRIILNIAFEEAREAVRELELCRTSDEIEKKVFEIFSVKWKHLFSERDLPAAASN